MIKIKNLCKLLMTTLILNLFTFSIATSAETLEVHTESVVFDDYKEISEPITAPTLYASVDGKVLIKEAICKDLLALKPQIDLSAFTNYMGTDKNLAMNLFFDVLAEHPEIFYADNSVRCSYSTSPSDGKLRQYSLMVNYNYDNATIGKMRNELNEKVNYVINNLIDNSYSEVKKQFIIHDYITQNCTYDSENYNKNTVPAISHTAYGALVKQVAVCDGYSKAMKLLLNKCGIECGVVISNQMAHAWNYVKIGGKYYQMDVTWDDPVPESNKLNYSYFNLSNAEMAKSHQWDQSKYPVGTSTDFDFLRKSDSYNTTRVNDRIFYVDNKKLYSSNLTGGDNKTVKSDFSGSNLVGLDDNNSIYYASYVWLYPAPQPTYSVSKLNLSDNSSKKIADFKGRISSLYIKDNNLNIKYSDNNVDKVKTIAIAKEEPTVKKDPKDVNGDGVVDILDLSLISTLYNKSSSDSNFNKNFDLNSDNFIDVLDMVPVSKSI